MGRFRRPSPPLAAHRHPSCPVGSHGSVSLLVAILVLASFAPASLPAQAVTGQVIHRASQVPLSGAFVLLVRADGTEIERTMTDPFGRFRLAVPRPGAYRLQAVAVGHQSWLSDPFSAEGESTVEYVIELLQLAVPLPALVVEADRDCRIRPEAGMAAAQLWEEARKVLESVVWTGRTGALRHYVARYNRKLQPRTQRVIEDETQRLEGDYRGSPFATDASVNLAAVGYVRELPLEGFVFDAPDANVLLSERFADVHCFAVRGPKDDESDLVGLAFEPVPGRDVTDIEGVLWLDGESAELRYLEYHYRRLPRQLRPVESEQIGGRVDFVRLPQGPWIVKEWWIRMPEVGLREGLYGARETVLLFLREQGGWVEEVRDLNDTLVWRPEHQR